MECQFVTGQKVQMVIGIGPISRKKVISERVRNVPKVGEIYTIRELVDGGEFGIHIRLNEIVNPVTSNGKEPSWHVEMFRPVIQRKTDISIFKALLNPSKIKEPAL